MFAFFKPNITIDGHQFPVTRWGANEIPMGPGQHHVHVHVPYLMPPKVGPADLGVSVAAGQATHLEYRAPVWMFSKGSLGQGPQSYNGMGALIAVSVGGFAFFLLLIVLLALI